ncbi:septum site-determining protein Ssd [Nonomuraea sp. NPDC050310]|uniref:septum site-determining protein Ssd n=1 Tax=Nonomuraea sp. NPDC050310 TaxID=3154935 RepID=UPI0033CA6E82
MNRPLVITEDRDLLDDLVRIAAAAGAQLDVAHAPAHARPHWNLAPVVLIGPDLADAVAATAPPPRDRVLLVTRTPEDPDTWRRCVAVGARAVLDLPTAERHLVEELADLIEPTHRNGAVLCVVGGSGGAGATVLAGCLALHASSQKLSTLLIDADPMGGGIDSLLGKEDAKGSRWGDLVAREGRVSATALREALPSFGDLSILSFCRGGPQLIPPEAMRSVLEAGRRGFDLVVVDLPRHLDAAAIEALTRATITYAVVSANVRGILAASQVIGEVQQHTADLALVARPGAINDEIVSASLDVPLAATFPDQPKLTAILNRGELPPLTPRSPLGRACGDLIRDLLP